MKFVQRNRSAEASSILESTHLLDFVKGVIASRLGSAEEVKSVFLDGNVDLKGLDPFTLPDMHKAIDILKEVRQKDGLLVCVVDYDADGINSGSVLQEGLSELGINVGVLVTDRHADGYGFSAGACNKILALEALPDVLVTADLGSSDGVQIERLQNECRKRGHEVKVIVTDHHHISEETPPATADAFINPGRKDVFHFFDNPICGAAVAWMLIKALSKQSASTFDPMSLVDFVGVATVGDMVTLVDPVNRAFVKEALRMMNSVGTRHCWNLIHQTLKGREIDESTIGFKIVPRINALSRMGDDGHNALSWLTSKDTAAVDAAFINMDLNNEERKEEQQDCQKLALEQALKQVEGGAFFCVCFVPEYTHGVVGLAAAHVVTNTGLPAIVFSVKDNGDLTGSARSIPGFDVRWAIEETQRRTGIVKKFGGHPMAAGLTLSSAEEIDLFKEGVNQVARELFNGQQPEPTFFHDGELTDDLKSVYAYNLLQALGPFGQGFEAPAFLISGKIVDVKLMGSESNHARVTLSSGDVFVWFSHDGKVDELFGKSVEAIVQPNKNSWNGKESIQFICNAVREQNLG